MKNSFSRLASFLAVVGIAVSGQALTIIPTFDSSITTNANAGAMIGAINAACQVFQANVTDPVTVKILFVNDPTVGLGQSLTWRQSYSYSAYLSALKNRATSTYDAIATGRLPNSATDPVIGGTQIRMSLALARRMGLETDYGPDGYDSTISVKMDIANFSRPPADPEKYDLQQVVEHEIDEVLSTSSGLPVTSPVFPIDLFRYTTNLARTFTTNGDNAYFSVDGTNLLARFNMNSGGDYSDWWSYSGKWAPPGITPGPQVQDAFNTPGVTVEIGPNEFAMLDVIGWTLSASANALLNPPSVAIMSPTSGAILSSSPIQSVTGTAADDAAALSSVKLALKRNSDGVWFNFATSSWGTSTLNTNNDFLTAMGTTSWSAQLPGLANGSYTVQAQAFDEYGHPSKSQSVNFTISVSPPNVAFSPLTNTATVFDFSQLGGTIDRPADVSFRIQQYDAGGNNDLYWNGTGFVSGSVYLNATVNGGAWSPANGVALPPRSATRYGPYFLNVIAIDAGGNASTNEILVTRSAPDTTPPIVTLDNIHNGDVITNSALPGLSGLTVDSESGIASVSVYLNRFTGGDIFYWNGSTWSLNPASLNATYNAQNAVWQVTDPLPSGGNLPNASYQVQVAVDNHESPTGIKLLSVAFSVDYHPVYIWTAGSWTDPISGNENNDWDNGANWNPGVPDTNGIVIINGTVTATGSKAVYALELNSGSLNTTGLLIHKKLNLNGGSLFGGMINLASNAVCRWSAGDLAGEWNILPGATFNFDASGQVTLTSGAINNSGLFTWTNSGSLWAGNGAVISNNAVIDLQGDGWLRYNNSGARTRLINMASGTIRKTSGDNSVFSGDYSGWTFENSGRVDVQNGTVQLSGSQNYLLNGGTITGGGQLAEIGGTVTLTGTTILTNGTFTLVSGQLVGDGQFAGAGTFDWQGGNLNGAGTITVGPQMQMLLSTSGDKLLANNSVLNNNGTGLIVGSGQFTISSGATFNNAGLLESQTNVVFFYDNSGAKPTFNNLPGATLRNASTNLTKFDTGYGGITFNNDGLVEAQMGKLQFGGGGSSIGEFKTLPDGQIEFTGQTQTLHNGASFTGAGISRIVGGRVNLDNPEPGSVTLNGTLELVNGGFLGGTGQLLGGGTLAWKGGQLDSTLIVGPGVTMNIAGSDTKSFVSGRLENRGTINWFDDGWIWCANGARLTNSGVFHAQGTATITFNNAGAGVTFDNGPDGTLRKSGNATNRFGGDYGGMALNNWGVIDVQGGELALDQSQKKFYSGGGITGTSRLKNASGTLTLAGTTSINGTLEFASGTIIGEGGFSGTGALNWSGGQINDAHLTNDNALTLLISPGPAKVLGNAAILQENGSTIVTEPANFTLSSGATFNNAGLMDVRTNAIFFFDNSGAKPTFNNQSGGIFRNSTTNLAKFDVSYGGITFNNSGLVDVPQGKLQFGGGGSSTGEFAATGTGEIEFTAQTQTLQDGASFTGAGVSRIIGGRVDLSNTPSGSVTLNGRLELSPGGFFGGSGRLLGNGTFDWKGGLLDATVTLGPVLTMNISGPNDKTSHSGHLANQGTINWLDDGRIWFGQGASLTNSGLFHAQGTATLTYDNSGGVCKFDNGPAGTLRKSGALTNHFGADYGGVALNNWGVIDVQTGALALEQSQKTFFSGGAISGTAPLIQAGGTMQIAGTTALNGTFVLAAGTLTGNGSFDGTGIWNWTGGAISAAQITNGPALTMLLLPGADKSLGNGSVLQQKGTTIVTEPGNITLTSGAILNNLGTFELRTNTTLLFDNSGAYPYFNNFGILRQTGTGTATFSGAYGGIRFANSGVIDLRNGTLALNGPTTISNTAELRITLPDTNTVPHATFAGAFDRNGALTITLTNGFVPTNGMSFTIATHSSASGEFAPVNLPALPFPLRWKLVYGMSSTTLFVERSHILSNLGAPVAGQFNLNFNGPAASAAILEASTNLVNWFPLQTNAPFTGTFNFADLQATNRPAKFYRVHVIP